MDPTSLLSGTDLHQKVIQDAVLQAGRYVWIATANLKDMHVAMARGRYAPILEVFDRMAKAGVTFRVIHSDVPSSRFRATLERFPRLTSGALEMQVCRRSHWKIVVVDGKSAYLGSANFTGAGLGARSPARRNLEVGVFTTDGTWVRTLATMFDSFWMGQECRACGLRRACPSPIRG